MSTPKIPRRAAERAADKVMIDPETGCHISLYSVASNGYPQIGWQDNGHRVMVSAHRAAWVELHGQIPDGQTIDHMCKNKLCVNVEHLRLLDNFENARRTSGRDWPLGQCVNGHCDENLVTWGGKTACRVCRLEWTRASRARRAGAA